MAGANCAWLRFFLLFSSSQQSVWTKRNWYIITHHSGSRHLCGWLLQTSLEREWRWIDFLITSLKNKLRALLLPVNSSGSEQNLMLSPPQLPGAQQLSVSEEGFCPSTGPLRPVLPTQHSAKPHKICAHLSLKLNVYYYFLFTDSFGDFYFVFVKFEWSVSICTHLFWSELLCSSATSNGSECCISPFKAPEKVSKWTLS